MREQDILKTENNTMFGESSKNEKRADSKKAIPKETPAIIIGSGLIRVRSTPSPNGKVTKTVRPGGNVTVLEQVDGYSKVQFKDNTIGFIDSKFLKI